MLNKDQKAGSSKVLERFPPTANEKEDKTAKNPDIRLYGRRFYKDQTPIEYLTEFLLVFTSPKECPISEQEVGNYKFFYNPEAKGDYGYWPDDGVALKLFSFFSGSKLETRHVAHKHAYLEALEQLKANMTGSSEEDKEEAVRLIQSLFYGFVGVAKNRTWVTYSFLPVTTGLLSRELNWLHSEAKKEDGLNTWNDIVEANGVPTPYRFFAHDRHNFMARGGELLYLQLVNLFSLPDDSDIQYLLDDSFYTHIPKDISLLGTQLEERLRAMLENSSQELGQLIQWAEGSLSDFKLNKTPKISNLGWVPSISRTEALLFAVEMNNICASNRGVLEKLDLLRILCSMQVLRSLCFQARRVVDSELNTIGFCGNYAWIVAESNAEVDEPIRKMAQNSFLKIDDMLYRAMRSPVLHPGEFNPEGTEESKFLKNADENVYKHFRKFAKEMGLVIPKKGKGPRFTLHQELLKFLVAALVAPGERIRLTDFYKRAFAHYGIALGGEQLATALNWCEQEESHGSYAISSNTKWVEEALQQGGFLVELSDAVSMIKNPG